MNKKDFKKIFKNGFGIEKFYHKQALRGKSEIIPILIYSKPLKGSCKKPKI